jgi:hypothetical protein
VEEQAMFRKYVRKVTTTDHKITPIMKKEVKPENYTMVPILSLKSVISLAIGLIIGAMIGLGYWAISPFVEFGGDSSLISVESNGPDLYESTAIMGITSEGTSYTSPQNLRQYGDFYLSKMSTPSFFSFMSEKLAMQAPEYSHDSRELSQMTTIKIIYDYWNNVPALRVQITSSDAEETYFLSNIMVETFSEYLTLEEHTTQADAYQAYKAQWEDVNVALIEAELEMSSLKPYRDDPAYIEFNAKIIALEAQLQQQSEELSILIASGDIDEYNNLIEKEYQQTLQEIKTINTALSEANQKLAAIEAQKGIISISSNDSDIITLKSKIRALEFEIDRLMNGDSNTTGLADMIARDITSSSAYSDTVKKIETASKALAEAKNELAILQSQVDDDTSEVNIDYYILQSEIGTLNTQLSVLQVRLIELSRERIQDKNQYNVLAALERTSEALAEAKKELRIYETSTEVDFLEQKLAYDNAQSRVEELRSLIDQLTRSMARLSVTDTQSSGTIIVKNLAEPSVPTFITPERVRGRNAIMMGSIIGLCGAWVILNFRWIAKGMPSSSKVDKPEEYEDEEA